MPIIRTLKEAAKPRLLEATAHLEDDEGTVIATGLRVKAKRNRIFSDSSSSSSSSSDDKRDDDDGDDDGDDDADDDDEDEEDIISQKRQRGRERKLLRNLEKEMKRKRTIVSISRPSLYKRTEMHSITPAKPKTKKPKSAMCMISALNEYSEDSDSDEESEVELTKEAQENPNMTQFHESRMLLTPPELIRQTNIVVPTVKAKEDHDTLPNRKQNNPSGRESDTPVSMVSLVEEGTSSDPGSSVKRKLDLESLKEPELLQISKKRKNPNDASTTKAENVRRSQRVQSNTRKDKVSGGIIADHLPKSLPRKFNVNRKNGKGETPLHEACIKNNITEVRELLNKPDIDVNARDNAGWTPLHEACIRGHTASVKELLKFASGKRMVTSTESRGMQTLDLLAAPSECGTTPLHDAVYNNRIEVVKLLVEAGGSILLTAKNKAGFTPFGMALTEVMKEALLGQRSEVSRLPAVDEENENNSGTESRGMETLDLLAGPSECGNTPLHDAATDNHIEVVKPLVEAGGISDSCIMSQASGKHKCSQCSYSSKRRHDVKRHFSRKHGKGQIHGRESSPERTTPNHTAVQSIITPVPGNAEKENGQQKALLVDSSLNEQMPEGGSLQTCENNAGSTPVNVAEREKEGILGQRSEVNKLPAIDEKNENRGSLQTCENNAGSTLVNVAEREEEGILGQRSEVSRLPAVDEENVNWGSLLTCENNTGFTPDNVAEREEEGILGQRSEVNKLPAIDKENENRTISRSTQTEVMKTPILGQRSEVNRMPAVDEENKNRRIPLAGVRNKAGLTPVDIAQTEVMKEANLGQRPEVSTLSAVSEENENNASTSKAVYVRRSPRRVKGGSKLDSNTTVKDRSRKTLLSSKPNLGKDEAMGKLPSEKNDAPVTPIFDSMDELLLYVAKLVPMDQLYELGTALKVDYAQIERYSVQNNNGSCKYEGTLKMLHVWTSKQKDNNIQGLSAALEKIGLNRLSESLKLNII